MENFKCKICDKSFSTKQSLDRHLNRKYKCDRIIICHKCGLTFKTKQHLHNHQNMKGDCLIKKINIINTNKSTLLDNFVNYSTLIDKIFDLLELIKNLESKNNDLLKEILQLFQSENDINNIKSKIISNKIKINEVTILKKIKKIKMLDKYCNEFMFNISNVSSKNKFQEINNILENINKIGMKKIPEINFQLWKSYKEFHTYLSESEENLVFCKIGKQIICIKNNGKIFKFEIGKVLLQDIM
jgi:hypothetical protein